MTSSSLARVTNQIAQRYRNDWGLFAREVLRVTLDREQEDCLYSIQRHRRVSIRSGNARGKDFVAAVASICFLILYYPSKVIETAPTQRQAVGIMMSEIKSIYNRSAVPLGGELLTERIVFPNDPDPHFLMAFKAGEKEAEPWSGFHSPNLMVVVSEATGLDDVVFDAIEGILQANSKLVLCFNPFRLSGEAYRSITNPMYVRKRLNCLDAPNVRAKKQLIPGQVDYEWVRALVEEKGWATPITESDVSIDENDFRWERQWYRPTDLFRIKVLGEPPKESEDVLIPISWIEAAQQRWKENHETNGDKLRLGVDVAGEGRDFTVFCHRYGSVVSKFDKYGNQDHMVTVGRIGEAIKKNGSTALIDTIGEGAGVYSRCRELKHNAKSAKFSESAKGLKDYSGQRTFSNIRAYCYWAVRDALNPRYDVQLALPPDDELAQELHETQWKLRSNGDIQIEEKDEIKARLKRSPDKADSLALTYYPVRPVQVFI
jgi:hypothetical protein